MRSTVAGWIRDHAVRLAGLVCLAQILVVVPLSLKANPPTKHFDIKAQPLSEALIAFGAQTGAIVMAASELTSGKVCNPVTGQFSPEDALTRMLQGTGLQFETSANGTIMIVRARTRSP